MQLTRHSAALVAAAFVSLVSVDSLAASACVQANGSAQDLRKAGKLREARAQLLVCAQKNCNTVIRNDCERWLKEVDEQTPTVVVRVVDARGQDVLGASVTIDDARIELDGKPVQVDPGQRAVRARARSGDVAETKVLIAQGEKARVIEVKLGAELAQDGTKVAVAEPPPDAVKPAPKATTEGPPILPITLGVVGAVALGGFAFFQVTGRSDFSDLENGCARTEAKCTDAEIDPVRSKFVASTIFLGVSVIALGAAAIFYFTRPKPTSAASPASTAFLGPGGAGLRF